MCLFVSLFLLINQYVTAETLTFYFLLVYLYLPDNQYQIVYFVAILTRKRFLNSCCWRAWKRKSN